jgi:hypothetical protein
MPSGACVIRYEGARGVTWKVKHRDADGRQVKETVGYVHLAGVVFRDEAAALENRMLGVPKTGTKLPKTAAPSALA